MSRTLRKLSLFALLLFLDARFLAGQVTTGTPPFGSFGGGPDVVNLANLNAHITVPVFSRAGRGIPFNYSLQYDTSIWYPVGSSGNQTWTAVLNWGLLAQTAGTTGSLSTYNWTYYCYQNILGHNVLTGQETFYDWYFYIDPYGIPHPLGAQSIKASGVCNGTPYQSKNGSATASDGSGYQFSTVGYTLPI
jgi:hypothetical protein